MRPRSVEHLRRLSQAWDRRYEPPCTREELVRLYVTEGMTQAEVAAYLAVSPKRIETAMRRFSIPARKPAKRDQRGPKNHLWKGSSASYKAKHQRVASERGKPKECELCGEDDPARWYDWANVSGDYDDPMDYVRVCRPCHRLIDADSYPRDSVTGRFLPKGVV